MNNRQAVNVQKGIWIDERHLDKAGLEGELEIAVGPGEIRIRPATAAEPQAGEESEDTLSDVAGTLSG